MDSTNKSDSAFTVIPGGRPIDKYAPCRFRPNDKVYIRANGDTLRTGPYIVTSANQGVYKLQDAQGQSIENGKTFEDKHLEEYNEFEEGT